MQARREVQRGRHWRTRAAWAGNANSRAVHLRGDHLRRTAQALEDQGRHVRPAADGPAAVRRRGLRQDELAIRAFKAVGTASRCRGAGCRRPCWPSSTIKPSSSDWPITRSASMSSRARTKKEQADRGPRGEARIDIRSSTHRLLSVDVHFADLEHGHHRRGAAASAWTRGAAQAAARPRSKC